MKNNKIRAIIFDVDGTLLDTVPDVGTCINRALIQYGFPAIPLSRVGPSLGGSIQDVFRSFISTDTSDELLDQIAAAYLRDYEINFAVDTIPFPGANTLLVSLHNANIRLGVVSNKTDASAVQTVKHFFPDIPFDFIWGEKTDRPVKPNPQSGLAAAKLLNLTPPEIMYIGDGECDIQYAKACGFIAAGAGWGYRGKIALQNAGADLIFDSLAEVISILY